MYKNDTLKKYYDLQQDFQCYLIMTIKEILITSRFSKALTSFYYTKINANDQVLFQNAQNTKHILRCIPFQGEIKLDHTHSHLLLHFFF